MYEAELTQAELRRINKLQAKYAALKASHDKLVERIKALEELLTCYRIGRNPTETLHRKLDETKQARKEAEAIK